ncbi:glycine betaine transporter [Sinobacterium caligoides]|uniref:Glycine betaine transporter n=1 Tax=Sinobacterium caligoides TaxID=933926 RepID=A0A3N2DN26_9GAMM|nr:BCCT family transporter [Sinobacterium caligoides]ROS01211.1 glycine betaine transporter [Sinobacterium caligoides]
MNTQSSPAETTSGRFSKQAIGLVCCLVAASLFLIFPDQLVNFVAGVTRYAVHQFGLAFIVIPSVLMLLVFVIAFSPFGRLRLGGAEAVPEFSFVSWTAMLFAAGMGSGLVFWGIAEPISHYANPPAFVAAANTTDTALALTYFHWGLHAWAIYAISGLVMAWFAFNRSRQMTISASFTGKTQLNKLQVFDFLAVVAVIFGVAGTLANSIALVQTGVEHSFAAGIGGVGFRLGLLLLIALAFTLSSASGLQTGIKYMSQCNLLLMVLVLVLVISFANPLTIVETIASSSARYVEMLPSLSFTIDNASRGWSESWSVIYFVWWIAWAPFVGPFIARISRGRTVRQFLLCTMLIPTLATIIWFSSFAGAVFNSPVLNDVIAAVGDNFTLGLFTFFDVLPFGQWLSLLAVVLLVSFVITSADSAIYVTGMLTGSEGLRSKLIWSVTLVAITTALVLKNNVLLNNQIAIFGALPFTLILLAQAAMLVREFWRQRSAE